MTEPIIDELPSQIIMLDADGNLTTDPAACVEGEVIETQPDGSIVTTWFTNSPR